MISSRDAWIFARMVSGQSVNGELQAVSRPFLGIARHLNGLPSEFRSVAWKGFLASRDDTDSINLALSAIDPEGPPPEADTLASYATLADIARVVADQEPLWPGWINRGVLNVVASEPGTGKTRFALDLARRLWFGSDWPDGQPNSLPKGTRTLWIQGDQNFMEMLTAARAYGLPDEAVALGSSPDDPTGSLDLDGPETLAALAERIHAANPALVVIDTVGMVTSHNLCRPEEAREFFAPIMELAGKSGVAFLGLTHLSANKEPLGRRIVEKARVVIKMTQPDPEGQPNRRRLWVDKTAVVKPPPLGITMADSGNDYDFNPPSEPEPFKPIGRPPEASDKARLFIGKALAERNDRKATELCSEWKGNGGSKAAFYRARDTMVDAGEITCEGKPLILHAIQPVAELDPEE
jgi:hypothetical protein